MGVHTEKTNAPRASNLDATRQRVVRRGCVVSYGGLRLRVQRVRMGQLYGCVEGLRPFAANGVDGNVSVSCGMCVVVA